MQTQQNYTQNLQAPIVSFIVTTYNLPIDYIKECLDSILQLSLNPKEREIILIDDGSDICPLNDLAEYLPNIIYLRQPNQGVSVARNYGMKIATGQMEIVIKSLGKYININRMISGATILGDGSVALIIDANTLV